MQNAESPEVHGGCIEQENAEGGEVQGGCVVNNKEGSKGSWMSQKLKEIEETGSGVVHKGLHSQ